MGTRTRVLHVDDNPFDRELVRNILEQADGGFIVTEAASRTAFEARLDDESYDVVLTDFGIPGFREWEVLDTLKARAPHLPVVIFTRAGSEEIAVEAMKRGAADYVPKDSTQSQYLANILQAAVTQHRLGREVEERLQTLSRRLVEVQEEERRRIARELHDEIGQALTALKINLQAIQLKPEAGALAPALTDSIEIVEQALEQVRNLSVDLRPSLLDDLGLVAALRWYVDRQAQRAGFKAQFVAEPPELALPPNLETACFRVAQEALTNIIRHAQAEHVYIALRREASTLEISIWDDGIGFDVPATLARAAQNARLGLHGMRERALLAGGTLDIISEPSRGTKVRARFPIH